MQHRKKNEEIVEIDPLIDMLKIVTPEVISLLDTRFNILRIVNHDQPIGRRNLSAKLDITERVLRKEANVLKDNGLLEFTPEGMNISEKGIQVLMILERFLHDFRGIREIETRLAKLLNIHKVFITPMQYDDPELMLKEIGKAASRYLSSILTDDTVLGMTGGSTLYHVIECFKRDTRCPKDVTVVPARGGIGDKAEYQANTLAEKLANKLDGKYKQLYTPDSLSKASIESLMNEPKIREIMNDIENIDTLIFGVGDARTMARRRGLKQDLIETLTEKGAVAEAFGYYFSQDGEIVHEISTIGISLDKFKSLDNIIAVAGGASKAEAIIAISKLNDKLVLFTDESVAKSILDREN
jgi:central glycolytic genes regulator